MSKERFHAIISLFCYYDAKTYYSYNDQDVYACASISEEGTCWQIRGGGGYHYISHKMKDSHAFGALVQFKQELLVLGKISFSSQS